MKIFQWVYDRLREPSSYAACAVGGVGIGVLLGEPLLIMGEAGDCKTDAGRHNQRHDRRPREVRGVEQGASDQSEQGERLQGCADREIEEA